MTISDFPRTAKSLTPVICVFRLGFTPEAIEPLGKVLEKEAHVFTKNQR
jgi:hypothetical protein